MLCICTAKKQFPQKNLCAQFSIRLPKALFYVETEIERKIQVYYSRISGTTVKGTKIGLSMKEYCTFHDLLNWVVLHIY